MKPAGCCSGTPHLPSLFNTFRAKNSRKFTRFFFSHTRIKP
jgi:hypothetical protein